MFEASAVDKNWLLLLVGGGGGSIMAAISSANLYISCDSGGVY